MTGKGAASPMLISELFTDELVGNIRDSFRDPQRRFERPRHVTDLFARGIEMIEQHVASEIPDSDVVVSFHYASLAIGYWLRVASHFALKNRTSLTPLETKEILSLYDWDEREGYLMMDTAAPEKLLLGCGCEYGSENEIVIYNEVWKSAYRLLRSDIFPSLLAHELDHVDAEADVPDILPCESLKPVAKSTVFTYLKDVDSALPEGYWSKWGEGKSETTGKTKSWPMGRKVRSFLVSFVLSIGCYGGKNIPHRVFVTNLRSNKGDERYASLALIVLSKDPKKMPPRIPEEVSDAVVTFGKEIARRLREIEIYSVLSRPVASTESIENEDLIRQACHVDWRVAEKDKEKYISDDYLSRVNAVGKKVDKLLEGKEDPVVKEFIKNFEIVGASQKLQGILEDIQKAVNPATETKEPVVIFLHSPPGCGKENLALLAHLMSPGYSANIRGVKALGLSKQDKAARRSFLTNLKSQFPRRAPMNYFSVNTATVYDKDRLGQMLFGDYRSHDVGGLLAAHFLRGTCFLDEFNTLPDRNLANAFLRLLAAPYEMEIVGRHGGPLRPFQALVIVASNSSAAELVKDGFNKAVIDRITSRSFEIPPLRERPVDIAVFVNKQARKWNPYKDTKGTPIRHIHLHAMKVLCQLPWPDNYRGLSGVLKEIFGRRLEMNITESDISFDEVMTVLGRRGVAR